MNPDEKKTKDYLGARGLTAERFSKAETRTEKSPDFRVFRNGEFLFYCEIKSIPEDKWLDAQLDNAAPGELAGGSRSDPVFNRLASDIHEALKQFDVVNKDQKHPNVLALVNHDETCGFNDLLGVLTGNFYAEDGMVHPIYRRFSHGRIRDEKAKIHLFLWLDDHKPDRLLFSQTHEVHHAALCAAFEVHPNDIKQIRSSV